MVSLTARLQRAEMIAEDPTGKLIPRATLQVGLRIKTGTSETKWASEEMAHSTALSG